MTARSPTAFAPLSLRPRARGLPDAYGIILPDDTRLILSLDADPALQFVGTFFDSPGTRLLVSPGGSSGDTHEVRWLDERDLAAQFGSALPERSRPAEGQP